MEYYRKTEQLNRERKLDFLIQKYTIYGLNIEYQPHTEGFLDLYLSGTREYTHSIHCKNYKKYNR